MVVKKWLRIEIGYESNEVEDCQDQPKMQLVLSPYFPDADLARWAEPGATYIGPSGPTDDEWVRTVLDLELNAALLKNGEDELIIGGRRQLFPELKAQLKRLGKVKKLSGSPGTRCKLLHEQWVNSRSYELLDKDGNPWPSDRDPKDALVFATVHWNCWPNDEAKASRGKSQSPVETSAKRTAPKGARKKRRPGR